MIVSNSTVLIFLAKLGKIEFLKKLFDKVVIPSEVQREVVEEGKAKNQIDAVIIEKAIEQGWIMVKECSTLPELIHIGIDKGEAEAISLAKQLKTDVLIDQSHARAAAKLVGINPKGTIFVLLLALRKGLINDDEYLSLLMSLIDAGFRMSEEVYLEAIRLGKEKSKN